MRESFVFYKSFYEAIKHLDGKIQGEIYTAIMEYGLYGNEIELGPVAKAMFTLIKPQIDINNKRYENGKKGGCVKTKQEAKKNQTVTKQEPNGNQDVTKHEPNVNVNDNVNVNVNDNDFYLSTNVDCEPKHSDSPEEVKQTRINYQKIQELYHSTCKSFPTIETLSESRKNKLKLRIAEFKKVYPDAEYMAVLRRIFLKLENSDFCKGENTKDWKASFDWIFTNDKNWIKIIEGNYDNKDKPDKTTSSTPQYGKY